VEALLNIEPAEFDKRKKSMRQKEATCVLLTEDQLVQA
jgi:hypothetical protein